MKDAADFRSVEELWDDEQRYKRSISRRGGGEKPIGRKRRRKREHRRVPIQDWY